jgi:signal transduction histidine kinase/ActR/RegA family two-component response regulator/uncharacterized protein HemY
MKKFSSVLMVVTVLVISVVVSLGAKEGPNTYEEYEIISQTTSGEEKVAALNAMAAMLIEEDNLPKAESVVDKINQEISQDDKIGHAALNINKGLLYKSNFDYKNALSHFYAALASADKAQDKKQIAICKNEIGHVFLLQNDYEEAETNLNAALEIREGGQDMRGATGTHILLGQLFFEKELYGKAKQHYKRAFDLMVKMQDLAGAADLATDLGNIDFILDDYESALVYYNTSRDIYNRGNDKEKLARNLWDIAKVLEAQGNVKQATQTNKEALELWKSTGSKVGIADSYLRIANNYIARNNKGSAEENLELSAAEIKTEVKTNGAYSIFKGLALAFEKLGNYKDAYQFQVYYDKSKDVAFNKDKSEAMYELSTRYNSQFAAAEKEQRIEKLEISNAASSKVKKFLLAVLGLGLMLVFNLFYSNKRKKKDNAKLMENNQKIEFQKAKIDKQNDLLEVKNDSLNSLNKKLVGEMAERESIEQSSFARDRFLATMSHEMRTPLNTIVGISHLLMDNNPRNEQIEQIRNLQFSANSMTVFVNDVLDFSKIEAGKLTLDNREFTPRPLFENLKRQFENPIRDKGILFNFSYDERIPTELDGDSARINQIFNNVLNQAMEDTDRGAIDMQVILEDYNTKQAKIRVKVRDTGRGLDMELLEKMFQDLAPDTDIFEGYQRNSIGLNMAKRLVELQNGKIEIKSTVGEGTLYSVLLPFKVHQQAAPQIVETTEVINTLEGMRILIVEDNKINQLVVARMLNDKGIKTVTADNGAEALQEVKMHNFDLILMDIQMPIMDGYKATAEIRAMEDNAKSDVPIIALTASAFLSELEKAKLFGMNEHVGKPFSPEELMEKITACLTRFKAGTA